MPQELEIDDEILYWFGYLISYWCFSEDISPCFILHAYDLKSILDAYETLHSLSVGTAIEKIMEEYKL
jgi:hypothetical protein